MRDGYAKNILSGYGSLLALATATVFHWLVFLFPWAWLVVGSWMTEAGSWTACVAGVEAGGLALVLPGWPTWPLVLIALGIGLRAVTAWFTRRRVRDALLMTVSAVLMTVIAAKSAYWQMRFGGPVWKGRVVGR